MSIQYANTQAAGFKNRVENIAIVGAGGSVGKYITEALLNTGQHNVTAISRAESKNKFPNGVLVKHINYDEPETLVAALTGQDVLIITLSVVAPKQHEQRLVDAAAKAGVPWILPNEWNADPTQTKLIAEYNPGNVKAEARAYIERVGKSAWIAPVSGFWYEFSLGGSPLWYGFDIAKRNVTFFDDGRTAINTSTFQQCGRAVAALLSLKLLPNDHTDKGPTLAQFKNNFLYLSSFSVNQRDMFDSLLRVTGTTESDWTIAFQDVKERYAQGKKLAAEGNRNGFFQVMYSRVFYPTDEGNFEKRGLLHNEVLGLPKEDLDEATKGAVDIAMAGGLDY